MKFVYVRSSAADKGRIPITAVRAADGAKIVIVPSNSRPGDLADIMLKSTFFDQPFTFTFTNVAVVQAKDGSFSYTLDPTDKTPGAAAQFTKLHTLLQNMILAKLPVNPDPRTAIVWNDPVQVQLTLVLPDATLAANVIAAKAADVAAQGKIDAVNKSSADADAAVAAAQQVVDAAKTKAERDAAKPALDQAKEIKAGIDAAKQAVADARTAAGTALTKAITAAQAGVLLPFSPATDPDTRVPFNAQYTTTNLSFLFQEGAP
jgi:hypothetical protein